MPFNVAAHDWNRRVVRSARQVAVGRRSLALGRSGRDVAKTCCAAYRRLYWKLSAGRQLRPCVMDTVRCFHKATAAIPFAQLTRHEQFGPRSGKADDA
jgi:hypothetical protein